MKQLKFLEEGNPYSIKIIELSGKVQVVSLLSALFLSSVIFVAALGKLFFPNDDLRILDIAISFFEMGLIACLIIYRNQIEMWLITLMVFALLSGYSLFWFLIELPCFCMGESIYVPHGFSLVIDVLFFSLSLCVAFLLGARKKSLTLFVINSAIFMLGGYTLAKWIFETILLT